MLSNLFQCRFGLVTPGLDPQSIEKCTTFMHNLSGIDAIFTNVKCKCTQEHVVTQGKWQGSCLSK